MSDRPSDPLAPREQRITVNDLRHKALAVRDTAELELRRLLDRPRTQFGLFGAVVVAAAVSFAYFMGSIAARSRAMAAAQKALAKASRRF